MVWDCPCLLADDALDRHVMYLPVVVLQKSGSSQVEASNDCPTEEGQVESTDTQNKPKSLLQKWLQLSLALLLAIIQVFVRHGNRQ